ncbi:MAG TPA: hypothetical protein VL651_05975 [Bacteroidia bacterium]|jgi:hypothetical protein|nr:hypothetical protein [Bacteroidia bacterium]
MRNPALKFVAAILLLIIPTISINAARYPGLKCPTDAKGGKRASTQTTHIRKKLVQPKHHSAKPQNAPVKKVKTKTKSQDARPAKVKKDKPVKDVQPKQKKQIDLHLKKKQTHVVYSKSTGRSHGKAKYRTTSMATF